MTWGVPLLVSYHFAFSYCSCGSQGKNTLVACHSLLQWTTFCQASPPRGAIPHWRSGTVAVRRYPSSKVRSSGCALLEQPWRDTPHQGKRNPSKMVSVARGHQRADTLKLYSWRGLSQGEKSNFTLVFGGIKRLLQRDGEILNTWHLFLHPPLPFFPAFSIMSPNIDTALTYSCFIMVKSVVKSQMYLRWKSNFAH